MAVYSPPNPQHKHTMKIALLYDDKDAVSAGGPADAAAEYDNRDTIDSLLDAIRAGGNEAAELHLDDTLFDALKKIKPDLVFNIAEGIRGRCRESLGPAVLEHMDVPYTGSDGLTLALSLDKGLSKTIALSYQVPTPDFAVIENLADVEDICVDFPAFVKPNGEGSSMGIRKSSRVENERELKKQVAWILEEYNQPCLVEEFIPGREFCVGLLGNEPAEMLPVVEVTSPGGFYSYEYKSRHVKELTCPADIDKQLEEKLKKLGRSIYSIFKCRDFARIDFKLDADGKPLFLELNPLPGLSPEYSIYPHQAAAAGIGYEQLINRIIESAMRREKELSYEKK